MQWKDVKVGFRERVLAFKDARFAGILRPGEHRFLLTSSDSLTIERHSLRNPLFQSVWVEYLLTRHADVVLEHFIRVETGETQIALVYTERGLLTVLLPIRRLLFWKEAAEVSFEIVDLALKVSTASAGHAMTVNGG